jgi:hypothetical protein
MLRRINLPVECLVSAVGVKATIFNALLTCVPADQRDATALLAIDDEQEPAGKADLLLCFGACPSERELDCLLLVVSHHHWKSSFQLCSLEAGVYPYER